MAWRKDLHCLIRHPQLDAVLLTRSDRWWAPPRVRTREPLWVGSADVIVDALERRLGVRPWILRNLKVDVDDEDETIDLFVEAAVHDPGWQPPRNGRWVTLADLGRLRMRSSEVAAVVKGCLETRRDGAKRQPWNRPGWLEGVAEWLDTQEIGEIREISQMKQWGISNSLRIEATSGGYFFKVSAPLPLFVNEAAVVPALARLLPGFVETPVSVNEQRGWLITRDLGPVVEYSPLAQSMVGLMPVLASLHVESASVTDDLLGAGCIDRRFPVLIEHASALFDDERIMQKLSPDDRAILRAADVPGLCEQLAAGGFPVTLVHGDFHPGNVIALDGGHRVIDWSDAAVSHPLFDLHTLDDMKDTHRRDLERMYLAGWEGTIDTEKARAALGPARILRPLHHAVSYRAIADGLEVPEELDFAHDFLAQSAAALRLAQAP